MIATVSTVLLFRQGSLPRRSRQLTYMPAAPIGLTEEGLPAGLQIIGPEDEDPTTIEFARLLAAEIGGFVPPPAYR